MMNRLSPHKRLSFKELVRRLDKVAADLNVLLLIVAVGLAALDLTFVIAQQIVEHMPSVTCISLDSPQSPGK